MSSPSDPNYPPGDPWSGGQPGYPQPGYPQAGYQQPGYGGPDQPTAGYPQAGYQQPGYPQAGYQQPGYPQAGYPQAGYPQAGYQQPGYPGAYGMPAYPGGAGGYRPAPGPPPERPGTVVGAFWLWMLVLVLGILANLLLFTGDYFQSALADLDTTGLSGDAVAVAVGIGRGVVIAGVAVALFIYLFFGLKMYVGRNWSRIVLTVLGGITVLSGALGNGLRGGLPADVLPGYTVALSWAQVAVAAVAIVLMFLPASNAFFAAVKARRAYR